MQNRQPISRRDMLTRMGAGMGTLGLAGVISTEDATAAASTVSE
ncbi:MAG: hypothetical protein QGF59_07780 [Pirellulaceae bacterium]|nr:hypothetical protein [Pirellulaceae bacterium]